MTRATAIRVARALSASLVFGWVVACAAPGGAPRPMPVQIADHARAESGDASSPEVDAAAPSTSDHTLQAFALAGFNLQSSDADQNVLIGQLKTTRPAQIWGLAEVTASSGPALEAAFEAATEHDYAHVMGSTGGRQYRLLVAFDTERFELIDDRELKYIGGRSGRAPLILELRDRESEQHLLFMVNHLQRTDDALRLQQARQLHDWASLQILPVIAVGDYNFDWLLANGDDDHDAGYDALTAGGVFSWLRPRSLFPTQCSSFRSVLDFVFVAQGAREWPFESYVLDTERPCIDNAQRSDHRPVWATLLPRK